MGARTGLAASVLLAARTKSQLIDVTDQIREAGATADYVVCDLADPDSIRAAIRATSGTGAIVNNSSVGSTPLRRSAQPDEIAQPPARVVDTVIVQSPSSRPA